MKVIYRSMDLITVGLILSTQITVTSVWLTRGQGFGISFTGNILGGNRTEAIPEAPSSDLGVYVIGLITALLMIIDQVNVIGTYVGPGRFSIVVGGPAFGTPKNEAYNPTAHEFFTEYREYVFKTFNEINIRED